MTGATECLDLPVLALSCSENRDCPSQSVEVSEGPELQPMRVDSSQSSGLPSVQGSLTVPTVL